MSAVVKLDRAGKWPWTPLAEITGVINGTTPKSTVAEYWGGDITWVTPTDLGKLESKEIEKSQRRITSAGLNSCGLTLVPPGSVILSSRAPIGHLAIAETELCFNQGCKAFIPGPKVDSEYLYYALLTHKSDLQNLGSGATFPEVSKSQLERFRIPLPPLEEQKRIAARLTEQLAAVERARRASEARLEAARALPAAWLQEIFESATTKSWDPKPLLDICVSKGQYGTSQKSNTSGKGPPVLGMKHIRGGKIVAEDLATVDLPSNEIEKYLLQPGDLLFNRTNSAELVGKTAVFDLCEDMVFASYLIRFRLDRETADPRFVSAFINSRLGRRFIESNMTRAIGQVNISASTMHELPVPLPPLALQESVMDELDGKLLRANKLEIGLRSDQGAIGAMSPSLLRNAFIGA